MKIIDQADLDGKRTFIRVDFNVPLEDEGGSRRITDDSRIRGALPTIRHAVEHGARVVLASHLGRPKGKVDPRESLAPAAKRLGELLGKPVALASDCVGPEVEKQVDALGKGGVLMLENLRFHAGEEKNDPDFAARLAKLADVYVNDAFGAAHRAHASTAGMASLVPVRAAGFLLRDELKHLGALLQSPGRPFVAILGGAKVSDKIAVIDNLLPRIDALLIGGAMAYTFFKALGLPVGTSLVEDDKLAEALRIVEAAQARGVELTLPVDHVVADTFDASAATAILQVSDHELGSRMGLDIGPETTALYASIIRSAKTVVWNGPMGVFEMEPFAKGTMGVAEAVAAVQGTTIIGGGDSVAAVNKAGVASKITHISTGGGASLEFLGGQTLPGVAALPDKNS